MQKPAEINIKKIYTFYLLYFLILPLGFFIRTFYSRTISLEEFGIIYAIIGFLGFISIFVDIGFNESIRYFIPKFQTRKEFDKISSIIQISFFIQILLILLSSSLIFIFSTWLSENFFQNSSIQTYLLIFLIYFIFNNLFSILANLFVAFKMNNYYQIIRFFQLSSVLLISILFFILQRPEQLAKYYAFSWGLASSIVFFIYIFIIFHKFPYLKKINKPKLSLIKKYLKYSSYLFSAILANKILSYTDILIITYYIGIIHVGIYSNVFALIGVFLTFFTSISLLLTPLFSEYKENNNKNKIMKVMKIIYGPVIFMILPTIYIIISFSNKILNIVYGPEFSQGSILLTIFAIFAIFKILNDYNLSLMNGLGIANKIPKIIFPIMILNVILNLLLVQKFELIGITLITTLGWFLLSILTYLKIKQEINFKITLKNISKLIFSILVFIISNKIFLKILYLHSLTEFIIALILSGTLYLITGYVLKIYSKNDLKLLIPKNKFNKQ